MRNKGCGQSIRLCFCCSFLLVFFPCSSTSHRMLSFSNWSEELLRYGSITWGPFFRNGLLHCGSPTGCISWHTTCSCMGPAWARVSFRPHPLAMVWGPIWAAVLVSASSWSSMGIRDNVYYHDLSGLQRNFSFSTWRTNFPVLWLQYLKGCFSYIFLTPLSELLWRIFLPFIKYFITEAQTASLVHSSLVSTESVLEHTGTATGQLLVSSHGGHTCSCPATKTLESKTQTH